ncbi:MAG: Plasmid stabilization system protein [Mucilaginibacter sp.]|nr:Plasmid stabilization system protein [Mucilaginibacter sp.]
MYKVTILPLAKLDIRETATWYNGKQNGLGKRFTTEVRQKVNHIKQDPFISVVRYDEVRTAVLEVFPFMIHYNVNEEENLIIILAVLHTSRNPDIWKSEHDTPDE